MDEDQGSAVPTGWRCFMPPVIQGLALNLDERHLGGDVSFDNQDDFLLLNAQLPAVAGWNY